MRMLVLSCVVVLNLLPAVVQASDVKARQLIINGEEGFLICSGGGTQNPLFSKDCKKLSVSRLASGGYEGTCTDNNGKSSFVACSSLVFEYARSLNKDNKSYWQQSSENVK